MARRFVWSSYRPMRPLYEGMVKQNLQLPDHPGTEGLAWARVGERDWSQGDAFETTMEWLYARTHDYAQ